MSLSTMERSPSSDELPRGVEAPYEQPGYGPVDGNVKQGDLTPDFERPERDPSDAEEHIGEVGRIIGSTALNSMEENDYEK